MKQTIGAVIVHQDYFLQQPGGRLVDDAADGPLDDGQSFVQVDHHHAEGGEVFWVPFLCTSETNLMQLLFFYCIKVFQLKMKSLKQRFNIVVKDEQIE